MVVTGPEPGLVAACSGGHRFQALGDAIDGMYRDVAAGKAVDCAAPARARAGLDAGARTSTTRPSGAWPAEFCARSATFRGRLDRCGRFRAALFPDDTGVRLFTAGVEVATVIGARMPRAEWHPGLAAGRSTLSLFPEIHRCGFGRGRHRDHPQAGEPGRPVRARRADRPSGRADAALMPARVRLRALPVKP
ncbi:hypothetical protein CR938_01275 [Pseudoxanthomonas taiwanensis]|uniref:Uncharacterized protein n=1 Tax=Pseudoxanthomonas taiwanensis TaxID=176598 RepID=A0A921NV29_9GAMM|nr:hypothetical protein CR938_01275 [Pseudoxanthomonas taiwanensis]MBO2468310.1 hypothetical protein [Xanthomonadaceae bacterium]